MNLKLRCRKCRGTWTARRIPDRCPHCGEKIEAGERLSLSVEILGADL
jgi:rubrerythrin